MSGCVDVALITATACEIADCLFDGELNILAANITMLGDTLNAILVNRQACNTKKHNTKV